MRGAIFDLDGTLWDAVDTFVRAWNDVLVETKRVDRKVTAEDIQRTMGLPAQPIAQKLFPDLAEEEAMELLLLCFDRHTQYLREESPNLFSGVREEIPKLAKQMPLYIVSNCTVPYIQTFLSKSGLGEYFSDWECIGRTGKDKSWNLRDIVDRNRLTHTIYIGDTDRDGRSAKKAGIPFLFAAYGHGKSKEKHKSFHDFPSVSSYLLEEWGN